MDKLSSAASGYGYIIGLRNKYSEYTHIFSRGIQDRLQIYIQIYSHNNSLSDFR